MTYQPEETDRGIGDALLRSLIDGANDGLFVLDPETGEIRGANQTVCDWLGYEREAVLDMTIFDCQRTFSEPDAWQQFVQNVREENGVQLENEIQTRTGSTIAVEGSISVVSADGSDYVVAIPRRIPGDAPDE
ncbi:PAS domain S-box protein [Natrinema salinisoli]|uniref:PAS domain S-box protein n=1 Tax=Natrinema salinisoli TaxID=2878535 RepID=UPI001CF0369C|nr:PAS domain-containing protein [Natrinema salinisoli]